MLAKVTSGSGLRGSLAYDLSLAKNGEPRGQWVAGSLIGSAREMARQASAFRALRPDCRKAILRVSLSADPQDGFLSEKKWAEIANDFLEQMGIDPRAHAWVAIRHADLNKFGQPHDHIHISVVRVSSSGELWNQEFSAKRAIKASEVLEQKHQLENHAREPPDRRRPQKNEREMKNRKGNIEMPREKITAAIDLVLSQNPDGVEFEDFKDQLGKRGVNLRASTTQSGRLQGFSFEADQVAFPGSKLGSDYGLSGLLQRGVQPPATAQAKPVSTNTPASAEAPRERVAQPTNQAELQQQLQPQQRAPTKTTKEDEQEKAQTGFLVPVPMSNGDRERRQQEYEQRQLAIQNRVDSSNFAKALSQLGASISHFAIEVIARIVEWLKAFLSRFGLGARHQIGQGANGQRQVALQAEVIEVEAKLIEPTPDPLMLDYRLSQGAAAVEQVTKAIAEKNFENLPGTGSPGREELVAELQKTVEDDGAAGFAAAASEQLARLEACFVAHKDLSTELLAKSWTSTDHPLSKQIDQAEASILRMQTADAEWSKKHPWQVKLGADAPNFEVLNQAKKKRANQQAQLKAEVERQKAVAAPAIAELETKKQKAFAALQASHIEFDQAAARAQTFNRDERFSTASARLREQTKKVHAKVSAYMSHFQLHIDPTQRVSVLAEIKATQVLLDKWALVAKTPKPEVPKPYLKEERRERPDDDQNQAPRG